MQKPRSKKLSGYKHRGIDYGCPAGSPVYSTTDGVVVYTGWGGYGSAYGLQVIIRTGNVWHTYNHLSAEGVSIGQFVRGGQMIARSGATGNVTGAHLHYQENTKPPGWSGNGLYAYQTDRPPRFIDAGAPAGSGMSTVFDLSFWAQAYAPWFGKAWAPRHTGIVRELRGNEVGTEASVHAFTEVFGADQVRTIQEALGSDFKRANRLREMGGPAGLETWYNDDGPWDLQRTPAGYRSPVKNRSAFVTHLVRPSTGDHVAIVACHGPIKAEGGDGAKAAYGRWFADLVSDVDGPVVVVGDLNVPIGSGRSPLKELRALGFRGFKEQAVIANESGHEFPSKRYDLSDIMTIPSQARITGGEMSNSSLALSDHRRIEARIVLP